MVVQKAQKFWDFITVKADEDGESSRHLSYFGCILSIVLLMGDAVLQPSTEHVAYVLGPFVHLMSQSGLVLCLTSPHAPYPSDTSLPTQMKKLNPSTGVGCAHLAFPGPSRARRPPSTNSTRRSLGWSRSSWASSILSP
eukprot:3934705-Rhodomonas_salina.4